MQFSLPMQKSAATQFSLPILDWAAMQFSLQGGFAPTVSQGP
jgi:hypothetical protein